MDYQCKCNECGLVLNSPESLEVHRQYHEGHLLHAWTQKVEEKNNNSPKELKSDDFSLLAGGGGEMVYGYPPTPQSSSSPYQEYPWQNQVKVEEYYYPDYTNQKWGANRYNPYNRPHGYHQHTTSSTSPVGFPPQPTPSPSPKQCEKCGFVCETAQQLIDHTNLTHPMVGQYYHYEAPKEESQILDLDSQKVVPQWSPTPYQGEFQVVMPPQAPPQSQEVVPPPAPPPQKSTNWKSNEARRPKTYNCTACNKWFTSSGHLKRHYNTTLHKNAVKSSGMPDPATMPISAHHHPARDSASSKDDGSRSSSTGSPRDDSTSRGSEGFEVHHQEVAVAPPEQYQLYPNGSAPHVTQATTLPTSTTGEHQPLPSFAEIQGYANVGGLGPYYAPYRPPLTDLTFNHLQPVPQPQQQLEEVVPAVEEKENPPASQPPPPQDESKTKCYDCDKVFNRPCYLTQHNKTFHNGDKPYKCSRCGKRFPDDETYRRHARKHAGDKPHKCDVCPKMFNHKTDLRRHLCCHTGKKPYACLICGKGFIRKDHMIKHTDTHARKREKMAAIRS